MNDVPGTDNQQFGRQPAQEQAPAPRGTATAISPAQALQPREAPKPPQRSNQARSGLVVFLNFSMSCLVFLAIVLCAFAYWGKVTFDQKGPLQTTQTVVVPEGASLVRITDTLQSNGVIDNDFLSDFIFRKGVQANGASGSMKAGEYLFKPGMSMAEVMETIRSGRGILHKVTVPEGLTVQAVFDRLAKDEVLVGELPETMPPEGSLMPDTYPYQRGTTRSEVIERMMQAQRKFLASVWDRRVDGLPLSSPEEMVILASIVEKETGRADERPRVASVFINRLRQGIKLQSDPTIIYGIFGGAGKPKDRPIFKSDISKETPYNTYVIDALPPGPIANPGRAALEAVANPSVTDDIFFVADGTGGHVFAKTLDEHNANVKRWRAIEKQLKEAQKAQEAEKASDSETQN